MKSPRHIVAAGLAALALALPSAGCGAGDFGLANFIDTPFGQADGSVFDLEADELEPVLTEVYKRFKLYVALRDQMPFQSLLVDACVLSAEGLPDGGARFDIDLFCAFPDTAEAGSVTVEQVELSVNPQVTQITIDYDRVVVGGVTVDGVEVVTETGGADGASVRDLAVVQDNVPLDYSFRLGLLDGDRVVLDYVVETASGQTLLVRLADPTTPGAAATALVTGSDGTLQCELRDVPWSPGTPARGSCDNGVVFGLP